MSVSEYSEDNYSGPDAATKRRWGQSFFIILALHASVAIVGIKWTAHVLAPEAPPPAIMIDLMPTPPAPVVQQKVEPVKPKELPVIEKAEVVLKKKPKPDEKPKPKPVKQINVENVKEAPKAPVKSQAPVEARPAVSPNYLSKLFAHLERYKKYPHTAGWRKPEGEVLLRVSFDREGNVLSSAIQHSSGNEALDEAALATIRRANPLPPLPDTMPQKTMTLNIPVLFNIKH